MGRGRSEAGCGRWEDQRHSLILDIKNRYSVSWLAGGESGVAGGGKREKTY